MKTILALPIALLLALSVPALAQNPNNNGNHGQGNNGNHGQGNNGNGNGGYRGAPGPIVGAGLPLLLIGGGIYWIVRRRKKTKLVS
jgi:LPXTG-motif cell wall-anchored protein